MAYRTVNTILNNENADISAAEAHGMATGMLCVDDGADSAYWFAELFGDNMPGPEERDVLLELFEQTGKLLNSEEFAFDLLLPDDADPLEIRAEALRSWCLGFLFGIGYANPGSDWPGNTGEILKDIVEITKLEMTDHGKPPEANADGPERARQRVDAAAADDTGFGGGRLHSELAAEEDEQAFMEINEYLRVAVQLIHKDFMSAADAGLH